MEQTKTGSFIEACINVAIGFAINFTANMLIFPMFGWHISASQNITLGIIYTVISVARSYAVRRWFNARIRRAAQRMAASVS